MLGESTDVDLVEMRSMVQVAKDSGFARVLCHVDIMISLLSEVAKLRKADQLAQALVDGAVV